MVPLVGETEQTNESSALARLPGDQDPSRSTPPGSDAVSRGHEYVSSLVGDHEAERQDHVSGNRIEVSNPLEVFGLDATRGRDPEWEDPDR